MMRPPQYAGRYYFPDPGRLRAAVESYIEDATVPRANGRLIGIIAPHSQLSEIGIVAGCAYKPLLTTPLTSDETLMLAPTAHAGDALLCDPSVAYDTLLDPLRIDRTLLEAVQGAGLNVTDDADDEPVIECHAPFVQAALGDVRVLPLRVPGLLDVMRCAPLAQHAGLIIACANLPDGHEDAACNAIVRVEAAFFDGAQIQKRGLFSRRLSKPARTPDATTIALALTLAKSRGATHALLLKRAGAFAAFALIVR